MNYHLEQNKSEIKKQEQLSIIAQKWQQKYDELNLKTFSDCFPTEENKTLSQLFKTVFKIGEQEIKFSVPAKYLLFNVVKKFAASFNLTNNFRDDQIEDFVNDIFEFYPHLTIRDIKFFLHQVKAGNFGQIYNRLDGPLLFGYLKVYSDLRIGEAERHELNLTKAKEMENYNPSLMFQKLAPILKETQKEIDKPRVKTQAEINNENLFLKISKEFNDLHRKQGNADGVKFVMHSGKMMDFEEYYNTVFLEHFKENN